MSSYRDPKEAKNVENFLSDERSQTDESLNAERGKTDDSLSSLRLKAEKETDATVKRDRHQLDKHKEQNRDARDRNQSVALGVHYQRVVDDESMESERSNVDAAIQQERTQTEKALNEVLLREREETDENLSQERAKTDAVVIETAKMLSKEVLLHSKTKKELTTRDELLAIVSHDLRNPLGSIMSCAELLLDDPEFARMGPKFKTWIEMIKRNADNSIHLISDILDMERIAEGKLELQTKTQNLSTLIRESVDSYAHLAIANRIELKVEFTENEIQMCFDRERLHQVLSNLIGNALKFTPEGGTVKLILQQTATETTVSVHDTGVGVADDVKEVIFARYAQLGKDKKNLGLGLGLYISKNLIELHKGRLWVDSKPNEGSIFRFSLPNDCLPAEGAPND